MQLASSTKGGVDFRTRLTNLSLYHVCSSSSFASHSLPYLRALGADPWVTTSVTNAGGRQLRAREYRGTFKLPGSGLAVCPGGNFLTGLTWRKLTKLATPADHVKGLLDELTEEQVKDRVSLKNHCDHDTFSNLLLLQLDLANRTETYALYDHIFDLLSIFLSYNVTYNQFIDFEPLNSMSLNIYISSTSSMSLPIYSHTHWLHFLPYWHRRILPILNLLISHAPAPLAEIRSPLGWTALHYAAMQSDNDTATVNRLMALIDPTDLPAPKLVQVNAVELAGVVLPGRSRPLHLIGAGVLDGRGGRHTLRVMAEKIWEDNENDGPNGDQIESWEDIMRLKDGYGATVLHTASRNLRMANKDSKPYLIEYILEICPTLVSATTTQTFTHPSLTLPFWAGSTPLHMLRWHPNEIYGDKGSPVPALTAILNVANKQHLPDLVNTYSDNLCSTPLHHLLALSSSMFGGNAELGQSLEALIEAGADPFALTGCGNGPLGAGSNVLHLLPTRADRHSVSIYLILLSLLGNHDDTTVLSTYCNAANADGFTPLYNAIATHSQYMDPVSSIVNLLLLCGEPGADPTADPPPVWAPETYVNDSTFGNVFTAMAYASDFSTQYIIYDLVRTMFVKHRSIDEFNLHAFGSPAPLHLALAHGATSEEALVHTVMQDIPEQYLDGITLLSSVNLCRKRASMVINSIAKKLTELQMTYETITTRNSEGLLPLHSMLLQLAEPCPLFSQEASVGAATLARVAADAGLPLTSLLTTTSSLVLPVSPSTPLTFPPRTLTTVHMAALTTDPGPMLHALMDPLSVAEAHNVMAQVQMVADVHDLIISLSDTLRPTVTSLAAVSSFGADPCPPNSPYYDNLVNAGSDYYEGLYFYHEACACTDSGLYLNYSMPTETLLCSACPPGSWCESGYWRHLCVAGTYNPSPGRSTECTDTCPANGVSGTLGTAHQPGSYRCSPIPGYFSHEPWVPSNDLFPACPRNWFCTGGLDAPQKCPPDSRADGGASFCYVTHPFDPMCPNGLMRILFLSIGGLILIGYAVYTVYFMKRRVGVNLLPGHNFGETIPTPTNTTQRDEEYRRQANQQRVFDDDMIDLDQFYMI